MADVGKRMVVGVDEVGRGSWAGPLLVVAARAKAKLPAGLKDSKSLTHLQRLDFYQRLILVCNFGEGWVKPREIDKRGLARALKLGAKRALKQLDALSSDRVILDGVFNYLPKHYTGVIFYAKADDKEPIVSAASIYAKVTRDNYMIRLSQKHVGYHFEKHVGYGTKLHREAIKTFGPVDGVHRLSFKPLKKFGQAQKS